MAFQAKRAKVRKIALAAPFCNGNDVIRVPNRFATPDLPVFERPAASSAPQSSQPGELSDTVQSASGANAFVALEDSLTKMAGISAEPPFLDAPVRTKAPASRRYFQAAPAADAAAVFAFRNRIATDSAPGHCALSTHAPRLLEES